jgi:hypothetical protein
MLVGPPSAGAAPAAPPPSPGAPEPPDDGQTANRRRQLAVKQPFAWVSRKLRSDNMLAPENLLQGEDVTQDSPVGSARGTGWTEQDTTLANCECMKVAARVDAIKQFRTKAPQPVRFGLSSFIGSIAMFVMNEVALAFLGGDVPENPRREFAITGAWCISYFASIWMQHWLHSTLVYGWLLSYWAGLIATYTGYFGSYILSIPINAALAWLGFNAEEVFAGTLVLTGIVNYFVFAKLLGGGRDESEGNGHQMLTPRGLYNPGVYPPDEAGRNANPVSALVFSTEKPPQGLSTQ